MILGQSWMKKYEVIIDMTNNFLAFWPGHYTHIGVTFSNTLSQPRSPVETAVMRIKKGITPQKMIKRGSKKDLTDFLQTSNKLSSKKRRQINKSKRKINIRETSSKKTTISSLDRSDKKELPILISATKKCDPRLKILI